MSKEDKEKFIEIIEQDIDGLFNAIEKYQLELKTIIEYIKIGKPFFSIDMGFFIDLTNKFCFEYTIPEESQLILSKKFGKRVQLFERIFFTDHNIKSPETFLYDPFRIHGGYVLPPLILIYFLYAHIFRELIISSDSIPNIFNKSLEEWKNTFIEKKISITLITYLKIFAEIGEYEIDINFTLISKRPHLKLENKPYIKNLYNDYISAYFGFGDLKAPVSPMRCYLTYDTVTEVDIEKLSMLDPLDTDRILRLKEKSKAVEKRFIEMINVLSLLGYGFQYEGFIVKYPWWFSDDINIFDKFSKVQSSHEKYYNIPGYGLIENDKIIELISLFEDVKKSGIFNNDRFNVISHRYFQIHNRDDLMDIIIDACVILEFLFTGAEKQELSYRLSLNATLFISSDKEEFEREFEKLRSIYKLRNTIVHGGDWEKDVKKLISKNVFKNQSDIIIEIRSLINRILRKLVVLLKEDPQILTKFRKDINYFLNHSSIIKN